MDTIEYKSTKDVHFDNSVFFSSCSLLFIVFLPHHFYGTLCNNFLPIRLLGALMISCCLNVKGANLEGLRERTHIT